MGENRKKLRAGGLRRGLIRLALRVNATPDELLARLDTPTLMELLVFHSIEPDSGARVEHTLARCFAALLAQHGIDASESDLSPYLEFATD